MLYFKPIDLNISSELKSDTMHPYKSSRMICLDFMQPKQLQYISIAKPEWKIAER